MEAIERGLEHSSCKNRLWVIPGSVGSRSNFGHVLATQCLWSGVSNAYRRWRDSGHDLKEESLQLDILDELLDTRTVSRVAVRSLLEVVFKD